MEKTLSRTDEDLKIAVADELSWTPAVNSTNIGVAVSGGAVTLSGEVDSYPQKLMAEKAALRVRGVTAIAQEITVRSDWDAANDTDVARDAAEAIARAVNVPDSVRVVVHEHIVRLSGEVSWHYQREAAARAVRYLRGVADVYNSVTIRPAASQDGVKSAITAALVRTARHEGELATVTADSSGGVTLAGTVHSWAERREAERTAWSAPGVTAVTNLIQIQP